MDLQELKTALEKRFNIQLPGTTSSNAHDRDDLIDIFLPTGIAKLELMVHDDKSIRISDLNIIESHQKHGLGRFITQEIYSEVSSRGFQIIDLKAEKKGSYAWARFGFIPKQDEWERISDELSDELLDKKIFPEIYKHEREELLDILSEPNPKSIWQIADSVYGKELLIDNTWEGYLDFNDAEALSRLKK